MAATGTVPAPFSFTYGVALDDDSLYVAGVARELENRDVPHTIIWERLNGTWQRYQWKNRTYGLAAYRQDGADVAVYLGYEGTLKVRSPAFGSREEILEVGDDAPSSLRTVSSIRVVEDQMYVSGMKRMVYCRSMHDATWRRLDDGMRLPKRDLSLAGIHSIDGHTAHSLYAVGLGGEIWRSEASAWRSVDSPTNLTLMTVRCISERRVVIGGEQGTLWVGNEDGKWIEVASSGRRDTFSCSEWWHDRCFVLSDSGSVFQLELGAGPQLHPFSVEGLAFVSWMFTTPKRIWFVGSNTIKSLGDDGWRDESPSQKDVS
jgi:hypothetical protein